MRARSGSMVRKHWLAGVLAALLVIGVPVSASAAAPYEITGRVAAPAGYNLAGLGVRAYVQLPDGSLSERARADVGDEGVFSLKQIAAPDNRIKFTCGCSLAEGFYAGPGKPLVADPKEAVPVSPGSGGITLTPVRGETLTVSVTMPPGYEWDERWGINVSAYEVLASGSVELSRFTALYAEGALTFGGLRPGVPHVLFVSDAAFATKQFESGNYHADGGLVKYVSYATPVLPGARDVKIVVTPENVPGSLSSIAPPRLSGDARVGEPIEASPGEWSFVRVDLAYQWLRDGEPVAGATSPRYVPSQAELGQRFAVRVTASREGFPSVTVTSASTEPVTPARPKPVSPGAAPKALKAPTVRGTARLGSTLTASPGTWDVAGVQTAIQWLRAGQKIPGATGSQYRLSRADVGSRVSVLVTATAAGRHPGAASSAEKKVAKGKPKVTAKVKSVKASKRAKVRVTVKVAGLAKPAGRLTVKVGKRSVKARLKASARGKVTVRLPKLRKGKYKVRVSYRPSTKHSKFVRSAKSKKVTLRVR